MDIYHSFMITYIALLTTGTICFIESMRTTVPMIRHIFNLETCISIVAAYFYSLFVEKISVKKSKINWEEITTYRYLDWAITTPMMLLVLCATLGYTIHIKVHLPVILLILLLNYTMLGLGYLGETKTIEKKFATGTSFVSFFMMFAIIYYYYVRPKYSLSNYVLYSLYFIVWSFYGVAYLLNEEYKNIGFNGLDLISKGLIGIGLWIYFTRIVV
jgi:bacteriorhodopsin